MECCLQLHSQLLGGDDPADLMALLDREEQTLKTLKNQVVTDVL